MRLFCPACRRPVEVPAAAEPCPLCRGPLAPPPVPLPLPTPPHPPLRGARLALRVCSIVLASAAGLLLLGALVDEHLTRIYDVTELGHLNYQVGRLRSLLRSLLCLLTGWVIVWALERALR